MVMIFASEKARNFLLTNGFVYTFRKLKRFHIGNDWINDGHGRPKIANVYINSPEFVSWTELVKYVKFSGFSSVKEWLEEIKLLNHGTLPARGWLYKVERRQNKWI